MINGISAVAKGLRVAAAQFERAAGALTSAAQSEDSPEQSANAGESNTPDSLDATISMMGARLAFSASLVALRSTTDLLAEAIALGGYGVSANERR